MKSDNQSQTQLLNVERSNSHNIEISSQSMSNTKRLIVYAIGIFVCYFYFGILQEKITRSKYGENKEYYKCTISLVFVQCVINAIFAKILLSTYMKQGVDTTRTLYYSMCSFTYLAAMVSSNMALIYVNYPTQVVGKSCKPIPVMILGFLVARKRYSLSKYLFVLMIVIGVAIFMFKDRKSGANVSSDWIGFGEILILLSLAMDGLTGAFQEKMRSEHKTQSGHMMLQMNLWSTLFLGVAMILSGELWRFIDFVGRYPYVIYNILAFSVLSAIGQMFIFLTVSEFGPLPCSIITTTRKFFTVLASVIFFNNSLSNRQWIGTALVFIGLTLDSIYSKSSPKVK